MHRHTPPDYVSRMSQYGDGVKIPKRGGNHLAIARKIIATQKRPQTYLAPLDPDATIVNRATKEDGLEGSDDILLQRNDDKIVSSLVGRYKRKAKKTTGNVCQGKFPLWLQTIINSCSTLL